MGQFSDILDPQSPLMAQYEQTKQEIFQYYTLKLTGTNKSAINFVTTN